MFKWKKKVLCSFPLEKNWIALLLKFYKHYWFYNQRASFPLLPSDKFQEEEGEQFRRVVKNEMYYERRPEFLKYAIDDYIIVDVYDLIFNNNTKNLEKIDSCFENKLSKTRLDLLATAKKHIIDICNMFGLDPEMNMSSYTTSLLTPKVIEVCDFIKNNKA